MAKKLPHAKDFRARELKDWNAITFRAYMEELHTDKFHIPYVTNNIAAESKNIKRMYEQYGKEVTKNFIDACFDDYRPSPQYPTLSFFFIYSYMRERLLPKVLSEHAAAQRQIEKDSTAMSVDEAKGWF